MRRERDARFVSALVRRADHAPSDLAPVGDEDVLELHSVPDLQYVSIVLDLLIGSKDWSAENS